MRMNLLSLWLSWMVGAASVPAVSHIFIQESCRAWHVFVGVGVVFYVYSFTGGKGRERL